MKKLSVKDKIALKITSWVGSMECACIFTVLALISLPTAIQGGIGTIISWIAQTFLQLVLLSIIMVGQSLESKKSDSRAERHYLKQIHHEEKIDEILKEIKLIRNEK